MYAIQTLHAPHATGAKQEGEVMRLRLNWPDGQQEWVHHTALHMRPHWHMRMIAFYESKAKRPGRARPETASEGAVVEPEP